MDFDEERMRFKKEEEREMRVNYTCERRVEAKKCERQEERERERGRGKPFFLRKRTQTRNRGF